MSADWYFMKRGFLTGRRPYGPINEKDLMHRIEKGEVKPDTMISSTSKTHGHWLEMRKIKPAISHWKSTHPDAA